MNIQHYLQCRKKYGNYVYSIYSVVAVSSCTLEAMLSYVWEYCIYLNSEKKEEKQIMNGSVLDHLLANLMFNDTS